MKLESAAVIVPYNDFLKGEVHLSPQLEKLAKYLKSLGYNLKKISILEEDDRSVACELKLFTNLYDVVIILFNGKTPCVGQALANITSQELIKYAELGSSNCTIANNIWPKTIKLLKSRDNNYSMVYFQRIFIVSFDFIDKELNLILKEHLSHYRNEPVYSKTFDIMLNGSKKHIEAMKNESLSMSFEKTTVDKLERDVLTLAAKDFESLVNGEIFLQKTLGSNILSSMWFDNMSDLIYQSKDKHLQMSIEIIEKCLDDYGIDNVFLSFNGGKDCTVLLHLVQTVLQRKYPEGKNKRKLFCLYVRSDNTFKEQDAFIEQCMIFYNLEVISVTGNIKEALQITINNKPNLKACFMGTRRTDPFCANLNAFQMTDSDWPEIMRCSPFLDWHYSDIWDYLLYFKVPYCKLYDYGYTSLGSAANTIRNPNLLFADGDEEVYLPAYKMLNENKERSGRNISKI